MKPSDQTNGNQRPTIPAETRDIARKMLGDLKYGLIINLICALLVTFLLNAGHYFVENLVASNCVGLLAYLTMDGGRFILWRYSKNPRRLFVVLCLVAVPFCQFAGLALFRRLWGYDSMRLADIASSRYVSLMLFTLMAAAASMLFFRNREKMIRLQAAAEAEKARAAIVERQALQAQLQMLQAQIEPHMLFNTLANLQGLIGFDPGRAQLMLDHLIQYLRATLSASRARSTTLRQEFALMDAYLNLMAIRMGQRLTFSLELPDALAGVAVPPMLLQPLVENAIRHGVEPKIDGGHIAVSAACETAPLDRLGQPGGLILTVSDTGLGLAPPNQDRRGTHLGLANIRERLAALHGDAAALTLAPGVGGGAVARLLLPLEQPPERSLDAPPDPSPGPLPATALEPAAGAASPAVASTVTTP